MIDFTFKCIMQSLVIHPTFYIETYRKQLKTDITLSTFLVLALFGGTISIPIMPQRTVFNLAYFYLHMYLIIVICLNKFLFISFLIFSQQDPVDTV